MFKEQDTSQNLQITGHQDNRCHFSSLGKKQSQIICLKKIIKKHPKKQWNEWNLEITHYTEYWEPRQVWVKHGTWREAKRSKVLESTKYYKVLEKKLKTQIYKVYL